MSTKEFPIAPTFAEPVVVNKATGQHQFNPIWLRWFLDVASYLTLSSGTQLSTAMYNYINTLGSYVTIPTNQTIVFTQSHLGFFDLPAVTQQVAPTASTPISAAPTAADYNALVTEINSLRSSLIAYGLLQG